MADFGVLSVGGLATGLDTKKVIEGLMSIKRRPLEMLQQKKNKYENNLDAIRTLMSKGNELKDIIYDLKLSLTFSTKKATSSNTESLTATASNSAAKGSYQIDILQLAVNNKIGSQGIADKDTTSIATDTGTFEIKIGDETISVDVDSTTTLQQLADKINDATDSVVASIINDGTPTNPYRLILTSQQIGTENAIQIVNNDTILDFTNKKIEEAYAYDTNQFDGTVTSSGAYTGTQNKTLLIKITQGGAIGTAKFKVSEDGGITWSDTEFTTSTTPTEIYQYSPEGVKISFTAGTQDFAEGDMFSIDVFNPQIQEAKDAIFKVDGLLFTKSENTVSDVIPAVTLTLKKITTSPVTLEVSDDTEQIKAKIEDFVSKYNEIVNYIKENSTYDKETATGGSLWGDATTRTFVERLHRIISSSVNVSGKYSLLSQIGIKTEKDGTLSIDEDKLNEALTDNIGDVITLFAGDDSSTEGIGDKLYTALDSMLDPYEGLFAYRENTLSDMIKTLNDQIEKQEDLLEKQEDMLNRQFAALEVLVQSYNAQSTYLSNQLAKLS